MKKNKPESQPQQDAPNQQADSPGGSNIRVIDTTTARKLGCWDIHRKLERLQEGYGHDQKTKPAEIASSSNANPRCAAILWRVERLEQYADEIRIVYEKEIESGRFADTPDLWAAVYAQNILPLVSPKIRSLRGSMAHNLWITGGSGPGEQATIEEALRRLDRLKARLESELANAVAHAEDNMISSREKRLRSLLVQKGWSTNDLAVHSGVDFHTADNFIKGKTKSYPNTRNKMAKALEVDPEDL